MDSTQRFTDRVDEYARYRPSYPPGVIALMEERMGLSPRDVIVDIGSGTGHLARLFLDRGHDVYAVEPNPAMRRAAEAAFGERERFRSVAGRAEQTDLPASCADYIVVGQAFHWFEVEASRGEFRRILAPGGWVVIVWNERRTAGTAFLEQYERLLERWGTDYAEVRQRYDLDPMLECLFAPRGYDHTVFDHDQELDGDGLRGRLLSSSYVPGPEHAARAPMVAALDELFRLHARGGRVRLEYDTHVYFGRLDA